MLLGDSFGLSSRPARSSGRSILARALGQADLLGPVELLVVAADGLDQPGRVGGYADRGGDRDPGQVDLDHDAVLGLAVAERHRDGLVVTEHVEAAPGLARGRLADLGHPLRRVDALTGQFGQRPAGRPPGLRRAQRHEQPEQRGAVRVAAAQGAPHQHGVDERLDVGGVSLAEHVREGHAGRGLELGPQRVARRDALPQAGQHLLDDLVRLLVHLASAPGRCGLAWPVPALACPRLARRLGGAAPCSSCSPRHPMAPSRQNSASSASTRCPKVTSTDSGSPNPPAVCSVAMPWQAARHMRTAWISAAPTRR